MKGSLSYQFKKLMLPGLKRWIVIILFGLISIFYGVCLLLGMHPLENTMNLVEEVLHRSSRNLPYKITGIIVIVTGGIVLGYSVYRMLRSILRAYLPENREALPDVLYRRRHLDTGPRVVVIGGGTGLSTLLKGLKNYTSNITAIVTVGDDGGSSGRLRDEFHVLPPGDIRNCITALADEEQLVTELFRYRFESGQGLEGHSFGNLFLTALCAITDGDMIEAVKTASLVLNSRGQVLPSTLNHITLIAEMEDGRVIRGESEITKTGGRVRRLRMEPESEAAPEVFKAIKGAELIILGPGSLYTSIIPNLLVQGVVDAIKQSSARRIYVCNVLTQHGETVEYSVGDHVEALLAHAQVPAGQGYKLIQGVLVNSESPVYKRTSGAEPVRFDPDRIRSLGVSPLRGPLASEMFGGHHDPQKLAKAIMMWYFRQKKRKKKPALAGKAAL